LLAGLLMFAPSIALVQLPLQAWVSRLIVVVVGVAAYQRNITLLAIPAVILSGIIQEGAKLIPIAAYAGWRKQPIPRFGLSIGALVGLGYGVTEAQWLLNAIFAGGFNLGLVSTYGLVAISGFWERFFTVAFHTASGAVLGWGIARRKWWYFYLITVAWHVVLNYTVILFQVGAFTVWQTEFAIAMVANGLFIYAFWLRWRNLTEIELSEIAPLAEIMTNPPTEKVTAPGEVIPSETLRIREQESSVVAPPVGRGPDDSDSLDVDVGLTATTKDTGVDSE
jgi:hypothetical protein